MIGCVAGEGHLDGDDSLSQSSHAKILALAVCEHARRLKVSIIVLKDFSAKYRDCLGCFQQCGFTRVPSLPMTKLNIDCRGFDENMNTALNSSTRAKLRKKFKIAARYSPTQMAPLATLRRSSARSTRSIYRCTNVLNFISKN
jgi:hypothetical protein